MERGKVGSRLLNDQRFFLSLSLKDFCGVITVFVVFSLILEDTPYALGAFFAALVAAGLLAPIRLKHRDHYIRDQIFLSVIRLMRGVK